MNNHFVRILLVGLPGVDPGELALLAGLDPAAVQHIAETENINAAVVSIRPGVLVLPAISAHFNGFQVCRRIVHMTDSRVILVTDAARQAQTDWGLRQGAMAVIADSAGARELAAVLRNIAENEQVRPQPLKENRARLRRLPERYCLATEEMESARHHLAQALGPIAEILVQNAAGTSPDRMAFFNQLASKIDDAADRSRFLEECGVKRRPR